MTQDSTISSLKRDLRRKAIQQRLQIESRPDDIDDIIKLFEQHIALSEGQIVSGYWPINGELDITPLSVKLSGMGIHYCLPVMRKGDLELDFCVCDETTKFKTGTYGIQEPVFEKESDKVIPDILIVPLLAFDRSGTRLGYGGGYYDKTLSLLKKHKRVTSVGLAYDQQICLFPLPKEDHDVPLDWVITPSKAYNFTK